MADFNVNNGSQKWYNILCIQEETKPNTGHHTKQESDVSICRDKQESDVSYKQTVLKEESSDDSTIISSQTSTLTRNQDSVFPSAINNLNFEELVNCLRNTAEYESDEESDDDLDRCEDLSEFRPNEKLEVVLEQSDDQQDIEDKYSDKQTNTECAFYPEHAKQMKLAAAAGAGNNLLDERSIIKRSQTFSPSAHVSKNQYICKLNRSDSDSAMPLYRRCNKPFERNAVERRSLRYRRQPGSMAVLSTSKSQSHLVPTPARTSLDLELDLQAQHTRLDMLNSELYRLRELKERLETAKAQGDTELASYLLEDQQFQNLIAQAESFRSNKTTEEKKWKKCLGKYPKKFINYGRLKQAMENQT